jgi:hypothetical protein
MESKGQTTQIFFFILAIIIIGLLLLFGVKYIMELGDKVDQIDVVRFKTDLEGYAEEITPVYGRWKKLELNVPIGINKVCFVQHGTFGAGYLYHTQKNLCISGSHDYNFLMCQSWQDNPTRNVYTDPFDALDVEVDLGTIAVVGTNADDYYLCIDTTDHYMKLKMTGYGDHVLIEEWT